MEKSTIESVKYFINQEFIYAMNEKQFDGVIIENDSYGFHWWKNNGNFEDFLFRLENDKNAKSIFYFKINKRHGLYIRRVR